MTYKEPTFSSLQKMKQKSVQARSVSDLPSQELGAKLQGPFDLPTTVSKEKGESIQLAAPSKSPFKQFDFEIPSNVQTPPAYVGKPAPALKDAQFHYPNLQTWSIMETESTANVKRRAYPTSSSQSFSTGTDTSLMYSTPQQPAQKPRYYISDLDKHTLNVGGKTNHNIQPCFQKALVHQQQPRKDSPVPRTTNKLDKTKVLAGTEYDKQRSQQHTQHTPRPTNVCPPFRTVPQPLHQASRSSTNLHSPHSHHQPSPPSPSRPSTANATPQKHSTPTPTPNTPPSLLIPRYPSSSPSPSYPLQTPTTTTPPRIHNTHTANPSPLSQHSSSSSTLALFQANPTTTFDAFLAPHKSGKGETYTGSANARGGKKKVAAAEMTEVVELEQAGGGAVISRRRWVGRKLGLGLGRKRGGELGSDGCGAAKMRGGRGGGVRQFSWEE